MHSVKRILTTENRTCAIRPTAIQSTRHCRLYFNVFLVRKVSGGWHPVINLKQLINDTLTSTLDLVGFKLNALKSELEPVRDIQFLGVPTASESVESCSLRAREIVAQAYNLSSQFQLTFHQLYTLWDTELGQGLTPPGHLRLRPLQRHFNSMGLNNLTNHLHHRVNSDQPVLRLLLGQWLDHSFLATESLFGKQEWTGSFKTHSRLPQLDHRLPVQAQSSNSHAMESPSGSSDAGP